jgi:hypothetical protein
MEKKTSLPVLSPMCGMNEPVDWLFVFKFNSGSFPGCGNTCPIPSTGSSGIFGGQVENYKSGHSQQYVYASSVNPELTQGEGCIGATYTDPLGATFAQIYDNPGYFYLTWNDQFYNNPIENKDSPWGHSKGILAWDENGDGMVIQVSTPSWPGSASKLHPRQNDGNTLGCINDDDIEVSQHFFSVKLNCQDVISVIEVLQNSSIVTDINQPSIVNNGGPQAIQELVKQLGVLSSSKTILKKTLSTGITLISKPSGLNVPPWQLVSAAMNGLNIRVASWWAKPEIYSTSAEYEPGCWASELGKPGAVDIATSGSWNQVPFELIGGEGENRNHAKLAVSLDKNQPLSFFGDMNQQGALEENYSYNKQQCNSSQNGRGGTFYVLSNPSFHDSLSALLAGESAPIRETSEVY